MWLIEPAAVFLNSQDGFVNPSCSTFYSSAKMERQGNVGEALGLEFLMISIELRQYCGDIRACIWDFYPQEAGDIRLKRDTLAHEKS
jgi:hypothetical protein